MKRVLWFIVLVLAGISISFGDEFIIDEPESTQSAQKPEETKTSGNVRNYSRLMKKIGAKNA